MMRYEEKTIALDRVLVEDRTYHITSSDDTAGLSRSIQFAGLINPPFVQPSNPKTFRIICGFKRIMACRLLGWQTVRVRILSADYPADRLAYLAIGDNSGQRRLNLIETTRCYRLIRRHLNHVKDVSAKASMLGIESTISMVSKIERLLELDSKIQNAISSGIISLPVALTLLQYTAKERDIFADLFLSLKPSLSKQREILDLSHEISMRESISTIELLNTPQLVGIMSNLELDRAQKLRSLRIYLRERRYPALSRSKNHYERQVKLLKMGNGLQLVPPRDFESQVYSFSLQFSSMDELSTRVERLRQLVDQPALTRILDRGSS